MSYKNVLNYSQKSQAPVSNQENPTKFFLSEIASEMNIFTQNFIEERSLNANNNWYHVTRAIISFPHMN